MVTVGSPAAGATGSPVASSKFADRMSTTNRIESPAAMLPSGVPSGYPSSLGIAMRTRDPTAWPSSPFWKPATTPSSGKVAGSPPS